MPVYLEQHKPARNQYRTTRRAKPTGAICIHTAENTTDVNPPDTGAEAVARYIATRDTPGSYHTIVDSDTTVRVGRYEWETFHEGTGGNRWSLGLAFACKAHQWPTLPADWVTAAIDRGALEAAQMAAWVKTTVGVTIPARRITATQYRNGHPGFISHAELDPARRTDPGEHFPWADFLDRFARYTTQERPTMPTAENPYQREVNEALQLLKDHSNYTGDLDGWFGPAALTALHNLKNQVYELQHRLAEATIGLDDAELGAQARRLLDLKHSVDEGQQTLNAIYDRQKSDQ